MPLELTTLINIETHETRPALRYRWDGTERCRCGEAAGFVMGDHLDGLRPICGACLKESIRRGN